MKRFLALLLAFIICCFSVSAAADKIFENDYSTFQKFLNINNIYDCTFSDSFAAMISSSKLVKTIGYNDNGQLGAGIRGESAELIDIFGINNVIKVVSGDEFIIALTQNGRVYSWGKNDRGQLGLGDTEKKVVPVEISSLSSVMDIAAGDDFALAVKYDGSVWAWGANTYGQLGLGDKTDRYIPTKIATLGTSAAVYAGNAHAAVFAGTAKIYIWGKNDFGQLGLGNNDECLAPVEAPEFHSGIDFAFGDDFTAVLKGSGIVYVCGKNDEGQLGLGHYDSVNVPTPIENLRQIAAIDAGKKHMAAISYSSVLYTWGSNDYSQLGSGDTVGSNIPLTNSLTGIKTDIKCGGYSTVVLSGAGPIYYAGNMSKLAAEIVRPEKPAEIKDIGILINNEWFITDVEPTIINGRTMLPMRAIFEKYGATLDWDDVTRTATATLGATVIKVTIDEATAYVNGQPVELDSPAAIVNDRTLVPVRFVSESLGFNVEWDADNRVVIITK